ncbi:hypothetical protein [Paenibacillus sp. GP183]|jgi:hypothetical protein|uniref:hypothetical protein n=1 Tax=Paenibacillus sp. GP183 TaxID=1882751 RepID=UPI000898A9C9|nr:hypothetical protein [Paenibacillus sp. GP183]SED12476.1 hypothetical protein SAMN05443246_5815 [Paenibacillus sp. GP183]
MDELEDRIMGVTLATEFSQDPVYKHILREKLDQDLFDEIIEELAERREYTTTEFENWYCSSPDDPQYLSTGGTMRHWLKEYNLYIESRSVGRLAVLDYKAVFRLKMLLLLRKNGMKPAMIAELAGVRPSISVIGPIRRDTEETLPSVFNQDDLKNMAMIKNFMTALANSGALKVNEEGGLDLRLETLIEKSLEDRQQLSLPDKKMEELEERLTEANKELEELKQRIDSKVSATDLKAELEILQQYSLTSEIECKEKIKSIYDNFTNPATDINQKEELIEKLKELEIEYPNQAFTIRMYESSATLKLSQYKQDQKELRIRELKSECLDLFNLAISDSSSKKESEEARLKLIKLHDENPDLSFEIRSYIANLDSSKKRKKWLGIF